MEETLKITWFQPPWHARATMARDTEHITFLVPDADGASLAWQNRKAEENMEQTFPHRLHTFTQHRAADEVQSLAVFGKKNKIK